MQCISKFHFREACSIDLTWWGLQPLRSFLVSVNGAFGYYWYWICDALDLLFMLGRPALVYSYEDRGLAGDVKALRAVEVISTNNCVLFCFVSFCAGYLWIATFAAVVVWVCLVVSKVVSSFSARMRWLQTSLL